MMALPSHNQKGMALLMTVLIISLVFVLTMQFNRSMRSSLMGAANFGDGIKLSYSARSALNITRAVLAKDARENEFDTLYEDWSGEALASATQIITDGSRTKITVKDHSGRIQINALLTKKNDKMVPDESQITLLKNFLANAVFDLDEEEVNSIVEALIDWLDEDDEVTGLGGAEDGYYKSLPNGYPCRNAPVEYLDEILLVKGITPDLFYGAEGKPGIANYLTSYGNDGKININTAEALVLGSLNDQLNMEIVQNMILYREDETHDLAEQGWYKEAPMFPSDIELDKNIITTASNYFSITAEASRESISKKVSGMVKREKNGATKLVAWKLE